MAGSNIHGNLIAEAAKRHLGAIGLKRKGRSRVWFQDNGWWLSVVEFQPSSWSTGSYLNVAAMWLWNAKDFWSFDEGGRVEMFSEFKNADQFALDADLLASRAKDEVLALSNRFQSPSAVASHLARASDENLWQSFHAAMAAMATGDVPSAQRRFDSLIHAKEHAPWVLDLKTKVTRIMQRNAVATDPSTVVAQEVELTRALLKLDPVDSASLWRASR